MKMPSQLRGDDLEATCDIVGVFFEKPYNTVCRKHQVLCSRFVSFSSVMAKNKVHYACLKKGEEWVGVEMEYKPNYI